MLVTIYLLCANVPKSAPRSSPHTPRAEARAMAHFPRDCAPMFY